MAVQPSLGKEVVHSRNRSGWSGGNAGSRGAVFPIPIVRVSPYERQFIFAERYFIWRADVI